MIYDPEWIALALVLGLPVILFLFLGEILIPIILSFLLAYFLDGMVMDLCKRISRNTAIIIVFSGFFLIYVGILFGPIKIAAQQTVILFNTFPQLVEKLRIISQEFELPQFILDFTKSKTGLSEIAASNMSEYSKTVLKHMAGTVSGATHWVVYTIIIPLLVFFFLKDKEELESAFMRVLPRRKELVEHIWLEMESRMGRYVRGKVWEIIIVGFTSWLAFFMLGFQYAAVLGLAAGISVIIPYVGALAVTIPIFILGIAQWGFDWNLAWLMIVHGLIQFIDGNILVPYLLSEAVQMRPTIILVSTMVFGAIWGVWGVFFAVPLATLIKTLVFTYLDYRDKAE
ncbi:MAG: AI-2E family transporter [Deltaproteobacteria bacterium]|nr:AI-2E family transporter [Deltaproteobacteria bacterium]